MAACGSVLLRCISFVGDRCAAWLVCNVVAHEIQHDSMCVFRGSEHGCSAYCFVALFGRFVISIQRLSCDDFGIQSLLIINN